MKLSIPRLAFRVGLLALLVMPCSVRAETEMKRFKQFPDSRQFSRIQNGMTMGEVLGMLGPCASKVRMETARKETWQYQTGTVVFKNGVVTGNGTQVGPGTKTEAIAEQAAFGEKSLWRGKYDSKRTAALFKEIMKEIPSDGDSVSPSGQLVPGFADGRPGPVRPMEMPRGDDD